MDKMTVDKKIIFRRLRRKGKGYIKQSTKQSIKSKTSKKAKAKRNHGHVFHFICDSKENEGALEFEHDTD